MSMDTDEEIQEYLRACVDIEPLALEEEYVRVPSDLAYWNGQFADAVRALSQAKFAREQTYARRRIELREELMAAAHDVYEAARDAAETEAEKKKVRLKSPTVDDIDSAVVSDPEYAEAKQAEIEAESRKARMYGVVDAVRTKRDMLVQMGADRRVEMQGDPILRQEARAAREVQQG